MSDINADPDQLLKATGFHVRCVMTVPISDSAVQLHLDVEHVETGVSWHQRIDITPAQLRELESLVTLTRQELGLTPMEPDTIEDDPDAS